VLDIIITSFAGAKKILQWTWSTKRHSKLLFCHQMVEKIIRHLMPSVEDSLNTTPARELSLFPYRLHGLRGTAEQFCEIVWRDILLSCLAKCL
jgi:hypothetical protein